MTCSVSSSMLIWFCFNKWPTGKTTYLNEKTRKLNTSAGFNVFSADRTGLGYFYNQLISSILYFNMRFAETLLKQIFLKSSSPGQIPKLNLKFWFSHASSCCSFSQNSRKPFVVCCFAICLKFFLYYFFVTCTTCHHTC
jgi:hypothetical protein